MSDLPKRGIVAGKAVEDGVLIVCDCGTETHVVTVNENRDPTPMEFAVTCDGCGTSHWMKIVPQHDFERNPKSRLAEPPCVVCEVYERFHE